METALRLKLGPLDHGRRLSAAEFEEAEYEPAFKYEIIDGSLYVSPAAGYPENFLETWLYNKVFLYRMSRPEVVSYVTGKGRVFVPERPDLTVPEPDMAAYRGQTAGPVQGVRWEDISPLVVAEVLVQGNPDKDLVRNVGLYWEVPSIQEYWVLDGRETADEPLLVARRRHGRRWVLTEVPFGETYTTRNLPGFELLIDPHRL